MVETVCRPTSASPRARPDATTPMTAHAHAPDDRRRGTGQRRVDAHPGQTGDEPRGAPSDGDGGRDVGRGLAAHDAAHQRGVHAAAGIVDRGEVHDHAGGVGADGVEIRVAAGHQSSAAETRGAEAHSGGRPTEEAHPADSCRPDRSPWAIRAAFLQRGADAERDAQRVEQARRSATAPVQIGSSREERPSALWRHLCLEADADQRREPSERIVRQSIRVEQRVATRDRVVDLLQPCVEDTEEALREVARSWVLRVDRRKVIEAAVSRKVEPDPVHGRRATAVAAKLDSDEGPPSRRRRQHRVEHTCADLEPVGRVRLVALR